MSSSDPTNPHPRIAFIGGGNMAAALIGGLRAHGWPATQLVVAERDAGRRDWLMRTLGVTAADDATRVVDGAAATVLAVKPQQMGEALGGLRLPAGSLVLSIAAGIRIDNLRGWLGEDVALVRSMPNTPALVGAGATALYAPAGTAEAARRLAQTLTDSVGLSCWVDSESQLDAVTALSGSGPAYFFLLAEAMAEAGIALGLAPAVAAALARQTLVGAGRLVAAETTGLATLRQRVTSKGGTTEAALARLETAGLRTIVKQALDAAAQRSHTLGDTPPPASR